MRPRCSHVPAACPILCICLAISTEVWSRRVASASGPVLALWLLGGTPAAAQQDGDHHLWVQGVATARVSHAWRLHLEVQPRWFEDVTAPFQVLVRTAVGRQVHPRVLVWAGHAWIAKPPGPGVTHEQRAWEQVAIALPARAPWAASFRWRQEQRWQDGWRGASHRTRLLGRTSRTLASPRWSAIAWNESMVTWNATGRGPVRGFDQNRLFGGLGRRVSPILSVEGGYVWFRLRQPTGAWSDSNVGLVTANLAW